MLASNGRVRQLAMFAAVGGGGLGLAGALLTGLVVGQAKRARRVIPAATLPPPRGDGWYGAGRDEPPVRLMMLGDSSAAGYGADSPAQTPGALLATGLAAHLRRPVELTCLAKVGAESRHLAAQVERALQRPPDVVAIMIGGNDVTHRVRVPLAVKHLVDAVRELRAAGVEVIVGTCPDLGTIRPIQPPLRWLARRWSRQLAAAQTIAVVEAGGRTVSLGDLLGPVFDAEPDRMFSRDQFHPSAEGYAAAARAILPTMMAALAGGDESRGYGSGEGVYALPHAAVEAAQHAGTEVSPTSVAGHDRGPDGRWAQLRRGVTARAGGFRAAVVPVGAGTPTAVE